MNIYHLVLTHMIVVGLYLLTRLDREMNLFHVLDRMIVIIDQIVQDHMTVIDRFLLRPLGQETTLVAHDRSIETWR